MSDVVHILNRYFEELRGGQEKLPALKVAFKEVGIATFLTSLTTAIGFLTLLTSTIEPIRNFGVYTAIGVFVAYLLAYSLLPAVLVLSKTPPLLSDRPQNDFWTRRMHAWCRWTLRNRKGVLIGSVVVLALGAWGTSRVYVDNYMLEDLREDHFLKQEFKYMSDKFAGVRPFELALTYDTATVESLWSAVLDLHGETRQLLASRIRCGQSDVSGAHGAICQPSTKRRQLGISERAHRPARLASTHQTYGTLWRRRSDPTGLFHRSR